MEDAKIFVKFGYPIPDGYLDDLNSAGTLEVLRGAVQANLETFQGLPRDGGS